MSRWTLPYKAGVVMALAALVIGITAMNAMAWPGGEPVKPSPTPQHGDNDDDDEGKGGHEKPKPNPQPQPQPPTPPSGQPSPPAPTVAPPAPTPPAPVVSQGVPTPAPQPVETEAVPTEQGGVPQSPVVAQAQPEAGGPESPAANRSELAKTGLDPALIALLGAMCLGGGGLLFRRALARN